MSSPLKIEHIVLETDVDAVDEFPDAPVFVPKGSMSRTRVYTSPRRVHTVNRTMSSRFHQHPTCLHFTECSSKRCPRCDRDRAAHMSAPSLQNSMGSTYSFSPRESSRATCSYVEPLCMCGRPRTEHEESDSEPGHVWSIQDCAVAPSATYGFLNFSNETKVGVKAPDASFLRFSDTDSAESVVDFMNVLHTQRRRLVYPDRVPHRTRNTRPKELSPLTTIYARLQEICDRPLNEVVQAKATVLRESSRPPGPRATMRRMQSIRHRRFSENNDFVKCAEPPELTTLLQRVYRSNRPPQLMISVVGSTHTLALPPQLEHAIRDGLQNAIKATNAWIVTGGTNAGINRMVGDLVSALCRPDDVVIGIVPWSLVSHREKLEDAGANSETLIVGYTDGLTDSFASGVLNPRHTCFLLVDDGRDGVQDHGEVAMRGRIERAICEEFHIAGVCIVIQGGSGTLMSAMHAAKNGTPLVVIEGTGGCADLLALTHRFVHGRPAGRDSRISYEQIRDAAARMAHGGGEARVLEFLRIVFFIVRDRKAVTIHGQESGDASIEESILRAIISVDPNAEWHESDFKSQMHLAMRWDRISLAQAIVQTMRTATDGSEHPPALSLVWGELLMTAIVLDKPDFVDFFLRNGARALDLISTRELQKQQATTPARPRRYAEFRRLRQTSARLKEALEELYQRAYESSAYWRFLGVSEEHDVSELITANELVGMLADDEGPHTAVMYENIVDFLRHRAEPEPPFLQQRFDFSLDHLQSLEDIAVLAENSTAGELADIDLDRRMELVAFRMLMFYAVCLNKCDLAQLFWQRSDESLVNALIASRLFLSIADCEGMSLSILANERELMRENSKKFGELAVGLVLQCYHENPVLTEDMLTLEDPKAHCNIIDIAFISENLKFLAAPPTQMAMGQRWVGELHVEVSNFWPFMRCFLLPLLGPALWARLRVEPSSSWARIAAFYSSPACRFWMDVLSSMVLLILFSVMVLTALPLGYLSNLEIIVCVFFVGLACEEIRQLFLLSPKAWAMDGWNVLDVLVLLLYFGGLGVRESNLDKFEIAVTAKTMFTLSNLLLWLRLLRFYAVSPVLGPKLIMVKRMLADVTLFVCLGVVVLLAYGIAQQSLLFPMEATSFDTFRNILYWPYFQFYGEMFLDEINEASGCISYSDFVSCGSSKHAFLVPLLLGAYLLFSSILLVNLLVAMFNLTYQTVQVEARETWHLQHYGLYREYSMRPRLPNPLSLWSSLAQLVWALANLHSLLRPTPWTPPVLTNADLAFAAAIDDVEKDPDRVLGQHLFGRAAVAARNWCYPDDGWEESLIIEARRRREREQNLRRQIYDFQEHMTDVFLLKCKLAEADTESSRIRAVSERVDILAGGLESIDGRVLLLTTWIEKHEQPGLVDSVGVSRSISLSSADPKLSWAPLHGAPPTGAHFVLTRWARCPNGLIVRRKGRFVAEVLLLVTPTASQGTAAMPTFQLLSITEYPGSINTIVSKIIDKAAVDMCHTVIDETAKYHTSLNAVHVHLDMAEVMLPVRVAQRGLQWVMASRLLQPMPAIAVVEGAVRDCLNACW
eukprot:m.103498 g.103498  ORF g.103498 m.103498 type:complete len:1566 (+) comp8856_c0_seq2:29-4726(+)